MGAVVGCKSARRRRRARASPRGLRSCAPVPFDDVMRHAPCRYSSELRVAPKIMPTEKRTNPPSIDETAGRGARRYYVSYAWADESDPLREAQVDKLCEAAQEKGIKIYRDKTTLVRGDLISDFMKQIGEGDRVFIFLSDKYLRSAYCMFELFEMWRNSRQNKVEFLSRVRFFTIDKARIGTPSEWLEYTQYWKNERDDLFKSVDDVGWKNAGDETIKRYRLMEIFTGQISDVLALFADVVQARTFDDFVRYGFEDPPGGSLQVKVGSRVPKRTYVIGLGIFNKRRCHLHCYQYGLAFLALLGYSSNKRGQKTRTDNR
jgi:TIR domain